MGQLNKRDCRGGEMLESKFSTDREQKETNESVCN